MNQAIANLEIKGKALAKAEKEYKQAFTREYYVLKSLKEPSSVILKIIYGQPEVSELREKRDIAEVEYKAAMEKIYALKSQKFNPIKETNDKEKYEYYEKIAEQHKEKEIDILEDFNNLNINFELNDNEKEQKMPKIIEDFLKI